MRKNILYIGLCIATLSMGFTGCSKQSDSQDTVKLEKDTETLDYACDVNAIETTKFYDERFKDMIDKMGEIDFETMSDIAFEYDEDSIIVDPTDKVIGKIKLDDQEGNYVNYTFYPNSDGIETLTIITYGDDLMEVTASDEMHTVDNKFYTYMMTRDTGKKEVTSEEDLRKFAFVVSKDYEEVYKKKVENNKKFEVSIDVEPVMQEDGTASFRVNTNLPDKTELTVSLSSGVYRGQTTITVENGTAETEVFTDQGSSLASGTYELGLYMASPVIQDQEVKDIIGVNGEFMTGKYVEQVTGYNSWRVKADIPVEIK